MAIGVGEAFWSFVGVLLRSQEFWRAAREAYNGLFPASIEEFVRACQMGDLNTVNNLKGRVQDINGRNNSGWAPLTLAAGWGNGAVLEVLLRDPSIQVDQRHLSHGRTAFMQASRNGYVTEMNMLLDRGAGINLADNEGWTPLMLATWQGHEAAVQTLLRRGADRTLRNNEGKTAQQIAAQYRPHLTQILSG